MIIIKTGEVVLSYEITLNCPIGADVRQNAALRRLGYSGQEMTAHGFRTSFSTLANESGLWHADAIERALSHTEKNEVRRAYARGEHWDERVRLANWWAGQLEEYKAG